MSERTSPDVPIGAQDGRIVRRGLDVELVMAHTHTAGETEATICVLGAEQAEQVYFGCFAWRDGEDIESRWDAFARQWWKWGLEPTEDEPYFSVEEGGVTYDHYYLVPVYEDCWARE